MAPLRSSGHGEWFRDGFMALSEPTELPSFFPFFFFLNYWKDSIIFWLHVVEGIGHKSGFVDGHLDTIRRAWLIMSNHKEKEAAIS